MSRSEKLSGIWSSLARWVGLSRTTTLAIPCFLFLFPSHATKSRIVVRYVATVLGSRAPNDAANSCNTEESSPLMGMDLLLTLGANDSPTRILRQLSSFDC